MVSIQILAVNKQRVFLTLNNIVVATWNINGIQARLQFLLTWLRQRTPDIVLLQELKIDKDRFPYGKLEEAGYQAQVHGQKSWNGVAILSRNTTINNIRTVIRGLPGVEEQGSRLISAEIEIPGIGTVTCVSVYVPNGRDIDHDEFKRKIQFLNKLEMFLKRTMSVSESLIIGGDFNLCPSPIDTWHDKVWDGKIFHTSTERKCFAQLLNLGLFDLFRNFHPDEKEFSWWDYRAGNFHKNFGLRIDFLLANDKVTNATTEIKIDREFRKKKNGMIASDHCPVIAELLLPA